MKTALIIISMAVIGCSPHTTYLTMKGSYSELPQQAKTAKTFDQVLSSFRSFLVANGAAVKEYNKATGEIISEPMAVEFTTEDKDGKPKKPDALIVCAMTYNYGAQKTMPIFGQIKAQWHLSYITAADSSIVSIRASNVINDYVVGMKQVSKPVVNYRSTGIFERKALESL